jgi:hypothetical protein
VRGGEHLSAGDFWPAFLAIGGIAALSALVYLPLAPEAGAEVSGRRPLLAKPAGLEKTHSARPRSDACAPHRTGAKLD